MYKYKVFSFDNQYIAAKKGRVVKVLYKGDNIGEAYRSIILDLGIFVPVEERKIDSDKLAKSDFE